MDSRRRFCLPQGTGPRDRRRRQGGWKRWVCPARDRREGPRGDAWRCWSALATGWILPSIGCQVEYAGMTLPSGRYMHDDVQYFPSGPDFPWANTQAATQRARMRAMGIEPPPPVGAAPVAAGARPDAKPSRSRWHTRQCQRSNGGSASRCGAGSARAGGARRFPGWTTDSAGTRRAVPQPPPAEVPPPGPQ